MKDEQIFGGQNQSYVDKKGLKIMIFQLYRIIFTKICQTNKQNRAHSYLACLNLETFGREVTTFSINELCLPRPLYALNSRHDFTWSHTWLGKVRDCCTSGLMAGYSCNWIVSSETLSEFQLSLEHLTFLLECT